MTSFFDSIRGFISDVGSSIETAAEDAWEDIGEFAGKTADFIEDETKSILGGNETHTTYKLADNGIPYVSAVEAKSSGLVGFGENTLQQVNDTVATFLNDTDDVLTDTVDNIGQLGKEITQDTAGVISMPMIILAGAAAYLIVNNKI